ncbi:M23 family metallopeptidase [Sphingomonas ginkgonis]|uniref:M23 family metallopeptidase n=1 Tax=Sphingomonas ginkgonis TaxID=2315330 RepID=A0A3R9WU96_9SPHN|nr:M23 family metallopeptidase [Sphingomonas ginkgonis]RST31947.1 M23 family metallopeptidase [Sphingomonas ginkgonis]
MAQALTATKSLFRDRDFFIHDGSQLRRVRLSAPVQAFFLAVILGLVAWSGYSAAKLLSAPAGEIAIPTGSSDAEVRARKIEQRQQLMEQILAGKVDPKLLAAIEGGRLVASGPLAKVEDVQLQQAALLAKALDTRYQVTAEELKKLGLTPARVGADGRGGPFEAANPTFKALFNSWKKLDQLQDGVIAIPSEKPIKSNVAFTSGFGVRSDPFQARAAMHPGIDLAGPIGTPIYATADGTVMRAGWNAGGYGNLVEIDHGKGIATRYGHMSAVLVSAGQHISRGQLIGRMGSTGRSTGSHLHYEVRIDGRAVNPIPFMKSTDYLLAIQKAGTSSMDQVAMGGPKR